LKVELLIGLGVAGSGIGSVAEVKLLLLSVTVGAGVIGVVEPE
jgi:hypothetical protein